MVNYVPVAVMYARIVWGIRRVRPPPLPRPSQGLPTAKHGHLPPDPPSPLCFCGLQVAVVDVGRSLACGTLNCLSGDPDASFACLHTDAEDEAQDRPDALICSLLRKDA